MVTEHAWKVVLVLCIGLSLVSIAPPSLAPADSLVHSDGSTKDIDTMIGASAAAAAAAASTTESVWPKEGSVTFSMQPLAAAKAEVKVLQQTFIDCLADLSNAVSACDGAKAAADTAVSKLNALRSQDPSAKAAREVKIVSDKDTANKNNIKNNENGGSDANTAAGSALGDNADASNVRVCSMFDIFPKMDLESIRPENLDPNVPIDVLSYAFSTIPSDCTVITTCSGAGEPGCAGVRKAARFRGRGAASIAKELAG